VRRVDDKADHNVARRALVVSFLKLLHDAHKDGKLVIVERLTIRRRDVLRANANLKVLKGTKAGRAELVDAVHHYLDPIYDSLPHIGNILIGKRAWVGRHFGCKRSADLSQALSVSGVGPSQDTPGSFKDDRESCNITIAQSLGFTGLF